jgi:hypothetical protein
MKLILATLRLTSICVAAMLARCGSVGESLGQE